MIEMKAWVVMGAVLLAAPAQEGDKLLLGFEPDELDRVVQATKLLSKAEKKSPTGEPTWVVTRTDNGYHSWTVYTGEASQGSWALGLTPAGGISPRGWWNGKDVEIPPAAIEYHRAHPPAFTTIGVFRRIFPQDWSAYDVLRFDVFCKTFPQTLYVSIEDEEVAPPVIRTFKVPAGQWNTIEVDLRGAAKGRGLDLKRLATLALAVTDVDSPDKKPKDNPCALVDNLRLCSKGSPAKLPVVRDATPWDLPEYYKPSKAPKPERMPAVTPDRSPLTLEKPFVIDVQEANDGLAPMGWVAAFDNKHLLVGYAAGSGGAMGMYALQSLDAGKTWAGLDGNAKATFVPIPNYDHQAGPGDVVGGRPDLIALTNLGCQAQVTQGLRIWSRTLEFTEKGWKLRAPATLVDSTNHHCNSNQSVVRSPDGRLWAAYGIVGRLGTLQINLRYSDDDGIVWKASREGTSGVIPGTLRSDKGGGGFGYYTFEEPVLVPFGKGVACFWYERAGYAYTGLKWKRFDGTTWSETEEIEQPKRSVYHPMRPPIHAVGMKGKEIFLSSSFFNGVLHYQDGKWTQELPELVAGNRISIAGDKTVVAVAAISEHGQQKREVQLYGEIGNSTKGPVVIKVWQRSANGKWSGPKDVAGEELPLDNEGAPYAIRLGLIVQAYAPPNFVPIAWSGAKQKWVKVLRVPVTGE